MVAVQFDRVAELPSEAEANSWYVVKEPSSEFIKLFVAGNDAVPRGLPPAIPVDLEGASSETVIADGSAIYDATEETLRLGTGAKVGGNLVATQPHVVTVTGLSVAGFGASQANSAAANKVSFQAAVNAAAPTGVPIVIPGVGNYQVAGGLSVPKHINFMCPEGATVNGATLPEILGVWRSGPEEATFSIGSGDPDTFTHGKIFRVLLQPGAVGHFEGLTAVLDVREYGTPGKFYCGFNGTAQTGSTGNVFGLNGYAYARTTALASTEIGGAEFNTDVRCAVVTRKVGFQVVDVGTSTGRGTVFDCVGFIAKQAGARGYDQGFHFGDGTNAGFPLSDAELGALIYVRPGPDTVIPYLIDAGPATYSKGVLAMMAGKGQKIGWGFNNTGNMLAGEIRTDANAAAGAMIFTDGGLVLQYSQVNGSRGNAIRVLNDGTNPVALTAGGVNRQVQCSATPPAGSLIYYSAP